MTGAQINFLYEAPNFHFRDAVSNNSQTPTNTDITITPNVSDTGSPSLSSRLLSPPLISQGNWKSKEIPVSLPGYVPMLPSTKNVILSENPILYNPKREVDRSNFTLGSIIGSGHFGKVFKGVATGLFYPNSKTFVAIKTTNNGAKQDQVMSLVCEAKILSNLDFHLNLVNLLGSCTSNFAESGNLWLLLEYCNKGNLKSFLQNHRDEFKKNVNGK